MSGHDDMCACGKNGTAEAHGYDHHVLKGGPISKAEGGGYRGYPVDAHPMNCDDVNAIRARVAVDLTREAMNPAQRALAWAQGRGGEYTPEAYEAAWAPAQVTQVDGAAR